MKKSLTFSVLSILVGVIAALAQDPPPSGGGRRGRGGAGRAGATEETWWVNKPAGGERVYKAPMRPLWRLADLKQMHAGQNNWSQLIIRDNEQDVTYNSGAPGTKITPRVHPDTPTAFVIIAGQMRFNVESQAPTVAKRGSIIHIMKTASYSSEVIGNENGLWIEVNILGYTTLYPTTGVKPDALPGAPVVKVAFSRSPVPYTGYNTLHFNTLDAIANCTVGPAVADDHMYINPLLGFVDPADNKCGGGGGNIGSGPAKPGDPPFNTRVPYGHMHSGAVEWWIVQVGAISGKFENFGEFHAVEGDVLYADAQGKFLRTFNPNIAINTHGMRVDRYGNIWVLDSFLNVLWKLKPNGEPVMTVGTRGEVAKWDDAKWNGMFNQPMDVAFDKDDNFYVVQGHGGTSSPPDCTYCSSYNTAKPPVTQGSDPRVFKFDKNGKYLSSRAVPHADGTYPTIHSVIVTPKGELWVTDRQLGKILVLDTNLSPLREIQQPSLTSGLFVDAKGHIWMSSGMDGMIMSLDENGKITGWLGKGGRDTDGATSNLIGEAHYLVVTPDQRTIYIADSVNAKVLKLEHD